MMLVFLFFFVALSILMLLFFFYIIILIIFSRGYTISPIINSPDKSIKKIIHCIENYIKITNKKNIRILDIGSGYGKLIHKMNKYFKYNKNIKYIGYEIAKLPYRISKYFNKESNVKIINDNILNLKDFNFDIVLVFFLFKQQKKIINFYKNFPKNTIIIANSIPIPFKTNDEFKLLKIIKAFYHWNIYIYKKL